LIKLTEKTPNLTQIKKSPSKVFEKAGGVYTHTSTLSYLPKPDKNFSFHKVFEKGYGEKPFYKKFLPDNYSIKTKSTLN
jgi:hypothetical protein